MYTNRGLQKLAHKSDVAGLKFELTIQIRNFVVWMGISVIANVIAFLMIILFIVNK